MSITSPWSWSPPSYCNTAYVGSVTGSRAVAVTTTSSGVPGSRIESVTTLDIGTSHGWVEATGSRIVRHVLNRTQQPGPVARCPEGASGGLSAHLELSCTERSEPSAECETARVAVIRTRQAACAYSWISWRARYERRRGRTILCQVVGIINGWAPVPAQVPAFEWLIAALSAMAGQPRHPQAVDHAERKPTRYRILCERQRLGQALLGEKASGDQAEAELPQAVV
jgi:hypothetical protein